MALPRFALALMLTVVAVLTAFVLMVKTTVLWPGDTDTEAGIDFTALAPLTTARFTVVAANTVCCMITRT